MNTVTRSRIAAISRAAVPVALIACAAAVLLLFPPTEYTFYPQCPIYHFLDLQCPGCGATRALAALLRGHFTEAFHLNALTTLMLPPATAYAAVCYRRYLRAEHFHWPRLPTAGIYAALTVAVLFAILRNLPVRSL